MVARRVLVGKEVAPTPWVQPSAEATIHAELHRASWLFALDGSVHLPESFAVWQDRGFPVLSFNRVCLRFQARKDGTRRAPAVLQVRAQAGHPQELGRSERN